MVKMDIFYRAPDDAEAFEKRYLGEHLPMVRKYANIKKTSFFKVGRTIVGDFPYAYIFSGTWDDKDGWKADMNSAEAKAATDDAMSFAPKFDVVVVEELA